MCIKSKEKPERSASRTEAEVWSDLEKLCSSPGYVHALAALCWRDNFMTYEEGSFKASDLDKSKSSERLLRSELSLLAGLLVKHHIDLSKPDAGVLQHYMDESDRLLSEMHETVKSAFLQSLVTPINPDVGHYVSMGEMMREAFFYASEQAYMFQYRDFAPHRYGLDQDWILNNMGFTSEAVKQVIHAIDRLQLDRLYRMKENVTVENVIDLTFLPIFMHSAKEIAQAANCDEKIVRKVLRAFSLPSIPGNADFNTIGAFNKLNAYPIIPATEDRFIIFQNYCLAESSYDSPAFWMNADENYAESAKKNRGQYTETFSAERLRHVLGSDHVHENVFIMKGKNRVGEIDVLAIYADRAIILQAKSKKLTEAARKGDDNAIATDFQRAVQDAYNQAYKCAEYIGDNQYTLTDERGNQLKLRRNFAEIFVFCVVSEYYPSLARQADKFLKQKEHKIIRPAYVMDIFFLDVLCELLDSPLQFFNFLHRRVGLKHVRSENELAILSYHLTHNLWFDDKYDYIDLGEDFSVHVDAAMFTRRDGIPGIAIPKGILTKLKGTFFDKILQQINQRELDKALELGYFLLESSEDGARQFSRSCEVITKNARIDRRPHDATMALGPSGITLHSSYTNPQEMYERLFAHCSAAKYRQKSNRWFGIALSPDTGKILLVLDLTSKWRQSDDMDRYIKKFFPRPLYKDMNEALRNHSLPTKKASRNDLCWCGSGKKFKKCCLK